MLDVTRRTARLQELRLFTGVKYSALFSQRYGVEKLLVGVKDLLLPGILLGMLDHQEE